eukprot:EG_transcript_3104
MAAAEASRGPACRVFQVLGLALALLGASVYLRAATPGPTRLAAAPAPAHLSAHPPPPAAASTSVPPALNAQPNFLPPRLSELGPPRSTRTPSAFPSGISSLLGPVAAAAACVAGALVALLSHQRCRLVWAPPLETIRLADPAPTAPRWAMAMAASVDDPTQAVTMADVRGETLGAAVVLEEAAIAIGGNQLLEDVELKILPRDRWGIVGPNGTGKSTLLKAITGQDPVKVAAGKVTIHRSFRVGYLEQKGVSGSTRSVRDEVASRMDRYQETKQRLEELEMAITEADHTDEQRMTALLNAFGEAQAEFLAAGGYDVDAKVAKVLKGLGFLEADFDRGCDTFSGGWQMRIALARLLLSEPEILILDEPTNHLDAAAKKWIATYLSQYEGTVLIVSHDENLLRVATTSIAEVRNKRLDIYRSRSYDQWLVEREEREQRLLAEFEKQQEEIAHLQSFVDRFGASANRASQAQSRVKMIEKLKKDAIAPPMGVQSYKPKLHLPPPPPCNVKQLELRGAAFGWGDVPIVQRATVLIEKGDRIVVRGPNGAGKSTLLRALSGELPLKAGQRLEGAGLTVGFFKQDLAQELPMDERAVDVVQKAGWKVNPELSATEVRTILGSLGLTQDKSIREIGFLSGGEKARVALGCFALVPHNLLLLDEPSNHLDVETVASLVDAIREFKGGVVVVSHDRAFCESLGCTHVVTVEDGQCRQEKRGLRDSDWDDAEMSAQAVELVDPKASAPAPAVAAARPAPTLKAKPLSPEEREAQRQQKRRADALERRFATLDEKAGKLKAEMAKPEHATDVAKLMELQKKLDGLEKEMDEVMEELDTLLS